MEISYNRNRKRLCVNLHYATIAGNTDDIIVKREDVIRIIYKATGNASILNLSKKIFKHGLSLSALINALSMGGLIKKVKISNGTFALKN